MESYEELVRMNYKKYLSSEHWKSFKNNYFEHYDKKCALCSGTKKVSIHHNNYLNKGRETFNDVVALCDDCHKKFHDIFSNNYIENSVMISNEVIKKALSEVSFLGIRFVLAILSKNMLSENNEYKCFIYMRDLKKYASKKMTIGINSEFDKKHPNTTMSVLEELKEIGYLDKFIFLEDRIYLNINKGFENINKIKKNYSILDLDITKDLKSKYEFGIYFIYSMYNTLKQGYKHYTIEEIGKFIGFKRKENSRTSDMIKYIEKAIVKINSKLEETNKKKIKLEKETIGKKIIGVKFIFT